MRCRSLISLIFFALMFKDSVGHPVATLDWGVDCVLGAFELATQMAISAVDRSGRSYKEASVVRHDRKTDAPFTITSENAT